MTKMNNDMKKDLELILSDQDFVKACKECFDYNLPHINSLNNVNIHEWIHILKLNSFWKYGQLSELKKSGNNLL